jgi:uncharacterized protein YbaP (TraB family)
MGVVMSRLLFLFGAVCLGLAAQPIAAGERIKHSGGIKNDKGVATQVEVVRPPIVQDYEPDPALWLLQDEDTKIYLFGTFHLLPEGFRWRNERLNSIVEAADQLIVETADDPEDEEAIASILGAFADRTPVSERMSLENGQKWRRISRFVEMKPDDFDRLPPILALFGVAMAHHDNKTGAQTEFGVETLFEDEFLAAGKPVGSIEKGSDILSSLLAIDEAILIEQIERDLAAWDGTDPFAWMQGPEPEEAASEDPLADEHDWARGKEMDAEGEIDDGTEIGRVLVKLLLDDRNRAWAEWLKNRLDRPGTVLVAVGAAHLAGPSSVQNHLRERGLVPERLNPAE